MLKEGDIKYMKKSMLLLSLIVLPACGGPDLLLTSAPISFAELNAKCLDLQNEIITEYGQPISEVIVGDSTLVYNYSTSSVYFMLRSNKCSKVMFSKGI